MLYLVRSDGSKIEIPFSQLEAWETELTELLRLIREAIQMQRDRKAVQ